MSVEAISWTALNLAPVPADRSGQPSSTSKFVLVGLANHAGPDGSGAFPSVRTLMRSAGLSERTVRSCLDRLEVAGLIRPCDPAVVAAKIKRADRRPGKGPTAGISRTQSADVTSAQAEAAVAFARDTGDHDALVLALQAAGEAARNQSRHADALAHFRDLRALSCASCLAE